MGAVFHAKLEIKKKMISDSLPTIKVAYYYDIKTLSPKPQLTKQGVLSSDLFSDQQIEFPALNVIALIFDSLAGRCHFAL